MGLLDWLSGPTKRAETTIPDDYRLASMVASHLQGALMQPDLGLAQIQEPNCMVVLDNHGRVSLRWFVKGNNTQLSDVQMYAVVPAAPGFSSFRASLIEFAGLGDATLLELYMSSLGREQMDRIAMQLVAEMKSNRARALAAQANK
jgi:hypothetical protein